ncbi:ADP-ribosylglycohydrolase family protein [bacterium]|nr:ADP-ribosylglycohydrolase family protein [bacterium]
MNEIFKDKVRGSIIAGACGDALGYIVEFVGSYTAIVRHYGERGLTDYDTNYYWLKEDDRCKKALFSDDTQMTLYTIEGLLEGINTGKPIIDTIRDSYLVWYTGQVGENVKISYDSPLSRIEELNQRRAPGNTCLSSLSVLADGSLPWNDSKGCGGIMRIAPIGLYGAANGWSLQRIADIAGKAAELTHLHPLSTYSSAACAVIIALCTKTTVTTPEDFRNIIAEAINVVTEVYEVKSRLMAEFRRTVSNAISLESDPRPDWEVIEDSIGGGWVAEETLAIALFSVLRHIDDFNACMICAVNHGGDSDSTGAVAGNILGAILGYTAIPQKFLTRLQLKDLLSDYADKLVSACPISTLTIV